MADAVRDPSPALSAEERADAAALAGELPALQNQLQELELLLQQNARDLESQRARSDVAKEALGRLEQGGAFTREQYQQLMTQAQQSELRAVTTQLQQELLQSKRETVRQLVDVARFAVALARRIDPDIAEAPPPLSSPEPAAPAAPPEPLPAVPIAAPSDAAILDAQEEERNWLARQLHNGPAQTLTNLILRAEICERLVVNDAGAAKGELGELRQTISRTLQDMRRFIFEIRPMILDDLGVFPALRRFVDDWNSQDRPAVTLTLAGPERRFARPKELAVFRIVQDAVRTAEGHEAEQARAVDVALDDQAIRLALELPAAGAQEAASGDGATFGYRIIQQRAAVVGGSVALEPRQGGRTLRVAIPL